MVDYKSLYRLQKENFNEFNEHIIINSDNDKQNVMNISDEQDMISISDNEVETNDIDEIKNHNLMK